MTKYSSELKLQIVQDYLSGHVSYRTLCTKYGISSMAPIWGWVKQARVHGLESLQRKRTKTVYSLKQKLAVVDYYQTSGVGVASVAAHFGISASQVTVWVKIFKTAGVVGLRPKPRGGRSTVKHKQPKQIKKKLEPSEKEAYQQEILKLRGELYHTRMERDFLKKLGAVSKNNLPPKKQ
ncbi:MAG: helix-turn-helix domain-containing protein [Oenococcus sp.]|uniref:transposase n=1 Tax=Oenococcus sp. TaxID=1979414 RepID=UPI0039EB120B